MPANSPLAVASPPTAAPGKAVELLRVLHVINGEYYAGAERVQDLLARNLPAYGFSVGFAAVKLDLFDELREWRDAPLFAVPMINRFDLRAAFRVAEIARQGGYRLLHGHTVRTALVGSVAAALSGLPLVYHAHSPTSRDSTRRWMDRLNGWIERRSLRGVARVIAVSRALAEHIAGEGFDPARIRVVPNGVPAAAPAPRAIRRAVVGRWASWPSSARAKGSRCCWKRWPNCAGGGSMCSCGRWGRSPRPTMRQQLPATWNGSD